MSDRHSLPDPRHYAYRVLWSPEDDEFVGLCTEFPALSWLDPDQDKALMGIRELASPSHGNSL